MSGVIRRHFIHSAHLRHGHVIVYSEHLHLDGVGFDGGNGGE